MTVAASAMPVCVVVPVYNAPDDLSRCVESVLACTRVDYRLVLIDDASPDPRVRRYFDELAARSLPHVALLANEQNLGFTGTANRGFAYASGDVVLLNSDTIVTSGWLDAILRCASSDPSIGTATPFSNNAEIVSFPEFCRNNRWPEGADPEPVRAALEAAAVPTYPELPTGVGFCLYVRRSLLDEIGPFDPAFGAGYGEENDFCMRAVAAGWRNVLCDDAFVLHTGERSFAGRREALVARHMQLLLGRHPDYMDLVRSFIAADPLKPLRDAALARLAAATGSWRGVLRVASAAKDGDAGRSASVAASYGGWRRYVAIPDGERWSLQFPADSKIASRATFAPRAGESLPQFLRGLCATWQIDVVEVEPGIPGEGNLVAAFAQAGVPCRAVSESAHDHAGIAAPHFEAAYAFSRVRVRDAFGYRRWTIDAARAAARAAAGTTRAGEPKPDEVAGSDATEISVPAEPTAPSIESTPPAAASDAALAGAPGPWTSAARRIRDTAVGRVAYRLLPERVLAALRARLR